MRPNRQGTWLSNLDWDMQESLNSLILFKVNLVVYITNIPKMSYENKRNKAFQ